MQEKPYPFVLARTEFRYEFESVSTNKTIKKIVLFTDIDSDKRFFNLALLDVLPNGQTSDMSESKNQDMITILATVIKIAIDFLDKNEQAVVLFQGSEQRRQRLYRILVNRELIAIQEQFNIFGSIDNQVEPFQSNQPYDFFLITKKQ